MHYSQVHENISRQLETEKLANHLYSEIRQAAGEIIVRYLRAKHKGTQISIGNYEWGNWPTTCVVKSGWWQSKSLSDTCTKYRYTKYLKTTGNMETCQPHVQSYRAGGWGNHGQCTTHRYTKIFKRNWERGNWPTTCTVKSGRRLGKSLSDTCVLSIGACKYLEGTWSREIGQQPV